MIIYLYIYIISCVLFALVYSFGQVGGYILTQASRFKIDTDLKTYITNGSIMFSAYVLCVIISTVLAPVIIVEDIIVRRKKIKGVKNG